MPIVSSISGLRVTEDLLSAHLIKNYANALSKYVVNGRIVIGRDGRPTGQFIENIVAESLSELGIEVILVGIVPTPTVQLAVERFECMAGISITASHNPKEWNGLKFINSEGIFFNKEENEKLWSFLDKNYSISDNPAQIRRCNDMVDYHIEHTLNIDIIKPNIDKIRARKFKVGVDAVNSSGSIIVPKLLQELNCEVYPLYCDNSGEFPHTPEPLPQNLTHLSKYVKDNQLDIGIAVDPDADRLVIINEYGNNIGEELTVCIAIDSVLSSTKGNSVVNLSTTAVSKLIAQRYDCQVYQAPVGEINVVNKMKETRAVIGGEGSGGVILPSSHYGRDSLSGIVLLLKILTERNCSISQLVAAYPKKVMVKTKQGFEGDFTVIKDLIRSIYKNEEINLEDGIRIDFSNSWVQIRKSNTEPIIRIIAEADSSEIANNLINKIAELVN